MSQPTYAKDTAVPATQSRTEIERLLRRYDAQDFATGEIGGNAVVGFLMQGYQVKITMPLPDRSDRAFMYGPAGRKMRSSDQSRRAYEQAVRSKWRSLVLILKAKLEAIASGVVTFEQEFGMHLVLPDGHTVAEHVIPGIREAYATNRVPDLLGGQVDRPAISER